MSNMSGLEMPVTYKDVLTLTNNYQGLGAGLTDVQDAAGNSSPMQIALEAVNFSRAGDNTFQLDGVALTATAANINTVCGATPPDFTADTITVDSSLVLLGGLNLARSAVTFAQSPYSVLATDYIVAMTTVLIDGQNVSVILPAPATQEAGRVITVKDESGSLTNLRTITVSAAAGNIDGGANVLMDTDYQCLNFYTNGTDAWFTLSGN